MKNFEYDNTYIKKLHSLDERKEKLYYMLNGKKDAFCYTVNNEKNIFGLNIQNGLPVVKMADDIICKQHEEVIKKLEKLNASYTKESHIEFRTAYDKLARYCFYFLCDFDEPLVDMLQTLDNDNVESLIKQVIDYQWMYFHFIYRDTKPWYL